MEGLSGLGLAAAEVHLQMAGAHAHHCEAEFVTLIQSAAEAEEATEEVDNRDAQSADQAAVTFVSVMDTCIRFGTQRFEATCKANNLERATRAAAPLALVILPMAFTLLPYPDRVVVTLGLLSLMVCIFCACLCCC